MPSLDDYRKLSDSELEAANQKLQAERSKLGDEQDRIAKVRDERYHEAHTAAILDGMSPSERDVLIEAAAALAKSEAKAPGGEG